MSSAVDDQRTRVPKLPLWRTIYRAYSIYLDNFLDVLRASSALYRCRSAAFDDRAMDPIVLGAQSGGGR